MNFNNNIRKYKYKKKITKNKYTYNFFKKQKEIEIQKQKQKEIEIQKQKQKEIEIQNQIIINYIKNIKIQKQKEIKIQKQKEIKIQKQKEIKIQKQKEIEIQKQIQKNIEIQKQIQKNIEIQKQKEIEIQKQKKKEIQKQIQKNIEIQKQIQKNIEIQKQKEIEIQKQKKIELQKQIQKNIEIQKQKEIEVQKQKKKEVQKQIQKRIELQIQKKKEIQKQKQKEIEIQKQKKKEVQKQIQKNIEIKKQKKKEIQKQKEIEVQKQKQKEIEVQKQKQKEIEIQKQKQKEIEIQKQKKKEVQKQIQKNIEIKKQKKKEIQKQKEIEVQKQKQKEIEVQKQKQKEIEIQKQKKKEVQKQIQKIIEIKKQKKKEIQKQKEIEVQKQKQKEIEIQKQKEIEVQKQIQQEIEIQTQQKIISKDTHRDFCIKNIELIKNIIIPDISKNLNYETVLIEFRVMPHLEFLIRNTIFRLPTWSHTIVCGNNNYEFIINMCNNISTNIKIIKLDINNLTPSLYSKLLMTKKFWKNFIGEKLLIYQEDTMLFHNKIEEFLKYDYIGAPWPIYQDDNIYGVGNGGFSLRSKNKMIECIEKIKPSDLKLGKSTLNYIKNTNSRIIPEDVYFSKSLIDYNLGNVSKRVDALKFSQETQNSINPLGGHQYWLSNKNIIPFRNIKLIDNYYKTVEHRGGWNIIINNLIDNKIIDNKLSNISLIDCCESFFLFGKKKNINTNWIGILHFAYNLPKHLEKENIDYLINSNNFKLSLKYCKGLICLSNGLKKYIKSKIKNINIYLLYHPIKEIQSKFDINNFLKNKKFSIIQLGQQSRKISTIYKLNLPNNKLWLNGQKINSWLDDKYFNNIINEKKIDNFNFNIDKYKMVYKYYTKTFEEYDNLLKNNIVIIPLWGASANNSILEIIEMNIPSFVTRLSETEEYLGKEYPMFFNDCIEIENIVKNKTLFEETYKKTHLYLKNMDKSKYSLKYFNSELLKLINQI